MGSDESGGTKKSGHPVIGVLSGCGGAGASVFAAVLAGCAAERAGHSFLIDCDPPGGGIDVLLGCEQQPGPRWAQVRLRGGTLDPAVLRGVLPSWNLVSFLAADSAAPLAAEAVTAVIGAAATMSPVLLDLPRTPAPAGRAAAARCDRLLLVTVAEVRALTATAMVAAGLDPARTSVLVRGSSRSLQPAQIATLLGLPVLGELPFDRASARPGGLEFARIRRRTRRIALQALDCVTAGGPSAPGGNRPGEPRPPGTGSAVRRVPPTGEVAA